jgi:hypothetical protein
MEAVKAENGSVNPAQEPANPDRSGPKKFNNQPQNANRGGGNQNQDRGDNRGPPKKFQNQNRGGGDRGNNNRGNQNQRGGGGGPKNEVIILKFSFFQNGCSENTLLNFFHHST